MFSHLIETDLNDYKGTMQARAFEGPAPIFAPKNVIRSDQEWGVKVDWEMHGALVEWLDAEFRISVFLESIGTGPEFDLAPVTVPTLSVPVTINGNGKTREYSQTITVAPGAVPPGVYKIVTCLQLFERSTGNPTPVAGFDEGRMVQIFKPAA